MTDNTFTRVDPLMVHDALLYGPHRQDAADYACAALRAAYAEIDRLQSQLIAVQEDAMTIYGDNDRLTAEIDRLRASALEWVTVTDDDATLPKMYVRVLVRLCNGNRAEIMSLNSRGDVHVWGSDSKVVYVQSGDRWAYIPEVPHE